MYKQISKYLRAAEYLLITTGAGMGADAGLPCWRGHSGNFKQNLYPNFLI